MIRSFLVFYFPFLLLFHLTSCSAQANQKESQVDALSFPTFESDNNQQRSILYSSDDYGQTWTGIGQDLATDIQASFIIPFGDEILLATDNAGLFLSKQNGQKWQQIGQGLPSKKINAVFVDGADIYVATYQTGIHLSQDYGITWKVLNYDLANLWIQDILRVEDKLIVGTDNGIYQLDQEQESWQSLFANVQVLSLNYQDNKLIAGTSQGSLISTNLGQDWQWIHKEGAVHYTHLVDNKIVEMYVHGDLFISEDWGQNWREATYQPRAQSYVYEVVQLGDYWLMSNNYGIHRSKDQGKSWQLIYPEEEVGFFDFLVIDEIVYACTREWDEYRGR